MATAELFVPDISCEHCERTVKQALQPIAGVDRVTVDMGARLVTVEFNAESVRLEQLQDALRDEDYPVQSATMVASA